MAKYTITFRDKETKTVEADNAYIDKGDNLCLVNYAPGTATEVDAGLFHWPEILYFITDRKPNP